MISCTVQGPNIIVPLRDPFLLIIFLARVVSKEDDHELHLFGDEVISVTNPIIK